MAKMYYDADADLGLIRKKKVAIIGYGSQGHAHALNLKDSGVEVCIGLPATSKSIARAQQAGLVVKTPAEAAQWADVVMMLVPDQTAAKIYAESIAQHMTKGKTLMFAHGFNIRFRAIDPPKDIDVSMVAPKAPGHRVREVFTEGGGVPGLIAVEQDASGNAFADALSYARGIGCTRAGVLQTTFKEETETDLFGEQAVLCGGTSAMVKAAFETLVNAGYQPEVAYYECLHELKLIVDLIYESGIAGMRYSVSDTAQYGDMTRGPRVIDEHVRETMRGLLREIQTGAFAKEWILENQANRPVFRAIEAQERAHPIKKVGAELRKMMTWIKPAVTMDEVKSGHTQKQDAQKKPA